MKTYIFDIENDGLLDDTTKLHSLVIMDADTGEMWSCCGDVSRGNNYSIRFGLDRLNEAGVLVGHNILTHDLPILKKLAGWEPGRTKIIRDTLTLSRLIWSDIQEIDAENVSRGNKTFPSQWVGSHALEAWGHRLRILKDDFGKNADWSQWSPEMQEYCEQDVRVTLALWNKIKEQNYSETAVELEHEFQKIIFQQERFGFPFDREKAAVLHAKLLKRKTEILDEMQRVFPPQIEPMKTPEYWYIREKSDTLGADPNLPKFKTKTEAKKAAKGMFAVVVEPGPLKKRVIPFNPGSRDQIAAALKQRYDWRPIELTDTGKAKIDETILEALPYPEAKIIAEYMMLGKRLGQLAEGDKAWLALEKNGRIHGRMITNGAVTGRCTHMNPNVSQVPSALPNVPYGYECRELFHADDGKVQVGADASGLELRCLGHYMAPYDGGAYGTIVVSGDVHSKNREALGLSESKENRDKAKRFIYAYLYGAGDLKIGREVLVVKDDAEIHQILSENTARARRVRQNLQRKGMPTDVRIVAEIIKGALAKESFLKQTPALAKLKDDIQRVVKSRGWLKGLDGRRLRIRSEHSALNTLLQSAGALIVKKGTVILHDKLKQDGFKYGEDYAQLAHIHDEIQLQARPEIADQIGKLAVDSFTAAGEFFNFRVPITGEYKIGKNWAECH